MNDGTYQRVRRILAKYLEVPVEQLGLAGGDAVTRPLTEVPVHRLGEDAGGALLEVLGEPVAHYRTSTPAIFFFPRRRTSHEPPTRSLS